MAREHARIWLDINSDDDFEQLPFDAQGLYTRVILTLDDLSYCGVATWRPRKLTTKAPDLTYPRIMAAASALEIGRYCLFDLDTEEVLARSFIRRDELLRNPKFAAAVLKAYNGIASKVLRAAVVTEIRRVRDEHPEYSSWTAKDKTTDIGAALARLMDKPGLDEVLYTERIVVPITNGEAVEITNPHSVQIGNTPTVDNTNPVGNGKSVRIPSTYTSTSTPAPLEGYVGREPHQGAAPDPNPPNGTCRLHPHGTDKPCRGCEASRKASEREAEQSKADAAKRLKAFWAEVEACPHCGPKGNTEDERGRVSKCPEHDWSLVHAG